jgi:hypothetical protein
VTDESDWRLYGQEKELLGSTLYWRRFTERVYGDDHAHCEFCWAKFVEEGRPTHLKDQHVILHIGYTTEDNKSWICDDCFADFHDRFSWKLGDDSN